MRNIKTEVKGNTLVITIDLKQAGVASESGKSEIIATTAGNALIENTVRPGLKLGLNAYVPVVKG